MLTQTPMLPGMKTRLPLALAAAANVMQTPIRSALQASASATQSSLTWHSASAFCVQKSVSVSGLLPPPPPHPASSPAIAASCASVRLVIVTSE